MSIGKILAVVVGILAVVVIGAVIWVSTLDFNSYKPEIVAQVKEATGRDLVIDGDIELAISLTPTFAVSDVKFANAPWGSRPYMATIDRFEAKAALMPLLSGSVDIERIVLKGADILIEKNAQGRGNYEFEPVAGEEAAADKSPSAPSGDGRPSLPIVRSVEIENLRLALKDAAGGQETALALDELTLEGGGMGAPVDLAFAGSYNGNAFKGTGKLGAPERLASPGEPWPLNLALVAGEATVSIDGTVAEPMTGSGLDLALRFQQADLSTLSGFAGTPLPPVGPIDLSAKVTGNPAKTINIAGLKATVGGSDLSGDLAIRLDGPRPHLGGKLASQQFDLTDFAKAAEGEGAASDGAGGAAGDGAAAPADGRVFPDDPLAVDGLKAADADLEIAIAKLVAGVVAEDVRVKIALANGDLNVAPIQAVTSGGKIDGRMQLNAQGATPQLATAVTVTNFDLGRFLSEMEITDVLEGSVNAKVDVTGAGKSVRQIMAGLNGQSQIVMGAGRMKTEALDLYIGGITAAVSKMGAALYAGAKPEYTVVNCFVSNVDVKDGLATNKALVFDTDVWTINGAGTVNLATEELNLKIGTEPKQVTLNTAVPITITGTLADPKFGVDPMGAAMKLGGLLGTTLFPPAALAGLVELGGSGDNPCLQQAKGGGDAQPAPSSPAGAAGDVLKDVEKGVGDAVKGLFGR